MFFAANLFAQNSLTNTTPEFVFHREAWFNSPNYISRMTEAFNAHIGAEIDFNQVNASSDKTNLSNAEMFKLLFVPDMTLTNATLEKTMVTFIGSMENHVWSYNGNKNFVHIQPITNALSMTRIDQVSFTNGTLFEVGKILSKYGLKIFPSFTQGRIGGNNRRIYDDKISLELREAFLCEILDAITGQIPDAVGWTIREKIIYFHGINEEKQ